MNVKVYAKCILAGEHAVIRGSPALVYPVKQKFLEISWDPYLREFSAEFAGLMKEDLSLVFWGVLEKGLKITGKKHSDLYGKVSLNNQVPIGAGLGASATLCVAFGHFFENLGFIKKESLYEFCRELENLFHGESSGVDIASTLMGVPIQFQRPHLIERIEPRWKPKLFLSYCGQRGATSECVRIVKDLFHKDLHRAQQLDLEMRASVQLIKEAFYKNEEDGLLDFVAAFNKAQNCFVQWGLTHGALDVELARMKSFGALAAKPTGSGRGGYVLSLWKETPPLEILIDMIPV